VISVPSREPAKSGTYTTFLTNYRAFIAQAIDPSFAISNPDLGPRLRIPMMVTGVSDLS
jgi:hypothetical protein